MRKEISRKPAAECDTRLDNRLYNYRPFDIRYIDYDLKKVVRHRNSVMKHFIFGDNVGLCLMRKLMRTEILNTIFVTTKILDINFYGF